MEVNGSTQICYWCATFHNSTLSDLGICHSGRTERMPPPPPSPYCFIRLNDVLASGPSRLETEEKHRAPNPEFCEDRDTSFSHKMRITLGLPSQTSFPIGPP